MNNYKEKYGKHLLPSLVLICIFAALVCLMFYTKVQENIYIKKMKQDAQKYINILNEYYDNNGSMPSTYHTDDESIVYIKESDSSFIIYFILGFDETITYHSNTKRWIME